MPKDLDASGGGDSSAGQQSDSNKSFVRKVKSRVSGFLPSSLSKWFGGSESGQKIRQRDDLEEDDDETYSLQPPSKRAKPSGGQSRESLEVSFISTPIHGTQNMFGNLRKDFQEPLAGPSGLKSRKLLLPNIPSQNHFIEPADLHNGDKDSDSGESTSGYSSMPWIGSKEHVSEVAEKRAASNTNISSSRSIFSNSYSRQERTLFTDRTATPQLNASLSTRRPAFNASTFGSTNFMDRTLSTKRIMDSPFYGGRTMYGGASASNRQAAKTSPDSNSCLKNFVQPKPATDVGDKKVTLSNTAKRILITLEQYSTPSEDVRKIPNPSVKRVQRPEGLISKYTGVNPYLVRDSRVPSNKELIVPTVSDLLKMKMKGQLQDSTVSMRQMATSSNSPLNTELYTLRTSEDPLPASKSTNKMKTKVVSVRQKPPEVTDVVEPLKLPDIRLPISTLPSFDFTIPSPYGSKECSSKLTSAKDSPKPEANPPRPIKTLPLTIPTDKKDLKPIEYTFSKPLVIAENLKSIKAINNFKFSEPVYKKESSQLAKINFTSYTCTTPLTQVRLATKNNGENGPIPAKELLKTGSVMDILGKTNDLMEKFKPAEGTWECKICAIRNAQDLKMCAACGTLKELTQEENLNKTIAFGDKFKMTSAQWECSVCMVRNDASKTKCVACENPKPTVQAQLNNFDMPLSTWECKTCLIKYKQDVRKCVACGSLRDSKQEGIKTTLTGFGDNFKITSAHWECMVCMVRNEDNKTKCVACENPRTATFKLPANKWECLACLVHNDMSEQICTFCSKRKPSAGFGTLFNMPTDKWECSVCMVRNDSNETTCVACSNPNPAIKCTTDTTKSIFDDNFNFPPDSMWVCPVCLTKNSNCVTRKCVTCEIVKAKNVTFKGFSDSLKKKGNEWECESCLVRNPDTKLKCQCCESVKPNIVLPIFSNAQDQTIPRFNFGIDKSQINGHGFTFGIQPESKKNEIKASPNANFIFGSEVPKPAEPSKGFSFGIPTPATPSKSVKRPANEVSSDSSKKTLSTIPQTNVTLSVNGDVNNGEVSKHNNEIKVGTQSSVSSSFIFGSKTTSAKNITVADIDKTQSQSTPFKFNTPIKSTPSTMSFANATSVTTSSSSTTLYVATSNIGFTSVQNKLGTSTSNEMPTFTFMAPAKKDSTPRGGFGGTKPTPIPPSLFTTGIKNAAKETPTFNAESADTAPSGGFNFSTGSASTTFNFSTPKTENPFTSPAPSPAFGVASTNTTFGTPTTVAGSVFGGQAASAPTFGGPVPNVSPFIPSFGATSTASISTFGGNSTPTFGTLQAAPPAVFPSPSDTPTFGAPAQPGQNGFFNFGSNASTSTPKTGFNFGAGPAVPISGGFNFGATNTNASPSGGFKFGSTTPAPAFSADVKPSFSFTAVAQPGAFTAQPQGVETKPPQRVIKRALRRTQR